MLHRTSCAWDIKLSNGKEALTGDLIYINSKLIFYIKLVYVVYVYKTT